MRIQGLNEILTETNVTGINYSSSVTVNDAYGYDAFVKATFVAVAPLAIASTGWNNTTDVVTKTAHGYQTGVCVRVTTSTTLPTGISAGTDYFVIRLGADTLSLASSLANAIAGTAVDFTNAGTGNHTLTQQTDVATFVVEVSPNNSDWYTKDAMTAISFASGKAHSHFETAAQYVRVATTITKGAVSAMSGWLQSKG